MSEFWADAFSYPLWVYFTIPFGAAFVGWITKILALKMMFHPVEFKGIKPYLGWQGQIPKRAPKMAAVAVDSLTSGILKPEELFDKIDPDELVKELGEPLREAAEELVDTMMMSFQPQVWRATPDQVKDLIVANVESRIPSAARGMFEVRSTRSSTSSTWWSPTWSGIRPPSTRSSRTSGDRHSSS